MTETVQPTKPCLPSDSLQKKKLLTSTLGSFFLLFFFKKVMFTYFGCAGSLLQLGFPLDVVLGLPVAVASLLAEDGL